METITRKHVHRNIYMIMTCTTGSGQTNIIEASKLLTKFSVKLVHYHLIDNTTKWLEIHVCKNSVSSHLDLSLTGVKAAVEGDCTITLK